MEFNIHLRCFLHPIGISEYLCYHGEEDQIDRCRHREDLGSSESFEDIFHRENGL